MAAVKKVGQKNGEVGLLVEYLFRDTTDSKSWVQLETQQLNP